MSNYSKIYNPLTNRFVKLNSKRGQNILNNYIIQLNFKNFYGGAMTIPEVQSVVACIPDYLDEMKKIPKLSDKQLESDPLKTMGALSYTLSNIMSEKGVGYAFKSYMKFLSNLDKLSKTQVNSNQGILQQLVNQYDFLYRIQAENSPGKEEGAPIIQNECIAYLKYIFTVLNINKILPTWVQANANKHFYLLAKLLQMIILSYMATASGNRNNRIILACFATWLQEILSIASGTPIIIQNDAGPTKMIPDWRINVFYNGRGICVNEDWTIECGEPLMRFVDLNNPGMKNGNIPLCNNDES